MGRVFVFTDVLQGRIPKKESFYKEKGYIEGCLIKSEAVKGGLFHGSFMDGNFTLVSDIDCFVVYYDDREEEFLKLVHALNTHSARRNISLNLVYVSESLSKSDYHWVDLAYLKHLKLARKKYGHFKEYPLEDIHVGHLESVSAVHRYVSYKYEYISRNIWMNYGYHETGELDIIYNETLCNFLQTALRAPMHVSRELLWLEGKLTYDDSSSTVVKIYLEESLPGAEEFKWIYEAQIHYVKNLERQLTSTSPDENSYRAAIGLLKAATFKARDFLRASIGVLEEIKARLLP